jgi:hypothetical protein
MRRDNSRRHGSILSPDRRHDQPAFPPRSDASQVVWQVDSRDLALVHKTRSETSNSCDLWVLSEGSAMELHQNRRSGSVTFNYLTPALVLQEVAAFSDLAGYP